MHRYVRISQARCRDRSPLHWQGRVAPSTGINMDSVRSVRGKPLDTCRGNTEQAADGWRARVTVRPCSGWCLPGYRWTA